MNHQENELIKQYNSKSDISLLGMIYKPYMSLVYGVCLKYLCDKIKAQDAVMDIFEKLIVDIYKYDTTKDFKTWLYVVTKNFCLMQIRHEGSEKKMLQNIASDNMETDILMHSIETDYILDLSPALNKCMEKIKDNQRRIIKMFFYEKMCYKEIAQVLKIEEKKVKTDIQNGKRNLRICIENTNKIE